MICYQDIQPSKMAHGCGNQVGCVLHCVEIALDGHAPFAAALGDNLLGVSLRLVVIEDDLRPSRHECLDGRSPYAAGAASNQCDSSS